MTKTKKLLISLAAVLCLALLPVAAWASPITIQNDDSVDDIQKRIQKAIDDLSTGGTVVVTGEKTDADKNLELRIPENVTVDWRADYSGSVDGSDDGPKRLIDLLNGDNNSGVGVFELRGTVDNKAGSAIYVTKDEEDPDPDLNSEGFIDIFFPDDEAIRIEGVIDDVEKEEESEVPEVADTDLVTVKVIGGTVKAAATAETGTLYGIIFYGNGRLTMENGTVEANGDNEYVSTVGMLRGKAEIINSTVTATGGNITTTEPRQIYAIFVTYRHDENEITVTGSRISSATASGSNCAVRFVNGTLTLTDSIVEAKSNSKKNGDTAIAINIRRVGTVAVRGDSRVSALYEQDMQVGAYGIYVQDGGRTAVTGGLVEAVYKQTEPKNPAHTSAINIYNPPPGVAAYLKGACVGELTTNSKDPGSAMIVEVDTPVIPPSRHGTSEGLTIKKPDSPKPGDTAVWQFTEGNPIPKIVFTLDMGKGETEVIELEWNPKPAEPIAEPSGGCADTGAGTIFAGLLIAVLYALDRRFNATRGASSKALNR